MLNILTRIKPCIAKQTLAASCMLAVLTACQPASNEQQAKPELSQTDASPTIQALSQPPKRSGAHGKGNPHAALSPEKLAQVALQHLAEGRRELALETLDQAILRYSDVAQLYGIRGSLQLEQREFAAALADLDRAVTLAPENPQYRVNRSQSYRQFGRPQEALKDLNTAVKLDENMLSARFNRGALLFQLGDFAGALADFDACVAIDPHAAASYFNRAAVYDAQGKRQQAIADLQRFLPISPSEAWTEAANKLLAQWQPASTDNGK